MADLSVLAERLAEVMFDKKISPFGLSRAVRVSKSTIYRYLSGQRIPDTEIFVRIADYFVCTTDFLLGLEAESYGKNFSACPPFAERFRFLLLTFPISKYRLSRKAGIPESILYTWQNGESEPNLESVLKLAACFGCTCDFVLGRGN